MDTTPLPPAPTGWARLISKKAATAVVGASILIGIDAPAWMPWSLLMTAVLGQLVLDWRDVHLNREAQASMEAMGFTPQETQADG